MKRRWKIVIGLVLALAVLLAVNTVVLESQTKEAEVTVDGGKIVHLSSGDIEISDTGEPNGSPGARVVQTIVLIHGYGGSMRWFDKLTPLLSPNHRVIRIDLLGFGGSEKPGNGYSIPDQARLVAEALSKLGVQGAMVVGHSMGGAVTASLAEQASELVDRAVLIDMAPDDSNKYGNGTSFLQGLSYTPVIGEALWRVTPDFVIRDQLKRAFAPGFDFASGFANADVPVEDFRQMTYISYRDARNNSRDFLDKPLNERFTSAAVPLMVIFGSEDQIFDPRAAIAGYSGVPGVETATINGAGHSPQVEKPKQVAAKLEQFAAPPVPASTGRKPGGKRKKAGSGAPKKPKSNSAQKKRSPTQKSSASKPGGSKKSKKSSKKKG